MAAAVSYYMTVALMPLAMVLLATFGHFLETTAWGHDARTEILAAISRNTSDQVARSVATALDEMHASESFAPAGLGMLLVTSLVVFVQFDRAFDQIWEIPRPKFEGLLIGARRLLVRRLRAFVMLLGVAAAALVVFVASLVISTAEHWLATEVDLPIAFWRWMGNGVSLVLNALLATLIYCWLPKARIPWRKAMAGGLLVALIWQIGRAVLTSFLIGARFSAYGVVGSVLAIMFWVYFANGVLFLGAEFVRALCSVDEPERR